MNSNESMLPEAKIIVAIDFGTTFSGFAYALAARPDDIFTFYDWPLQASAGAKLYCKTQTSLWYVPGNLIGTFDLQYWGWPAYVNYSKALQAQKMQDRHLSRDSSCSMSNLPISAGHFFTKFKLHLAPAGSGSDSHFMIDHQLPDGISTERMISDYLRQLSVFIMAEMKNKFGNEILKKHVQWCLTIPTIWDHRAKDTMVDCAEMAGLVQGRHCQDEDASSHPIRIVLEPEAASVYCQQQLRHTSFRKGSRFLVVDVGGGTVDLVVHEKVDDTSQRVKEVACSRGALCGGTFVDKRFLDYLAQKIDCFQQFSQDFPASVLTIKGYWENLKCSFDGLLDDPYHFVQLPPKLVKSWKSDQKRNGLWRKDNYYDEIAISAEDMKNIFDGDVDKILQLVQNQLVEVPNVEAIVVVGGFSNSPYLMKRIREKFSSVKRILSPAEPGSAVCRGAVAFGILGAEVTLTRKSRKTYGLKAILPFREGDPPDSHIYGDDGTPCCRKRFLVFIARGDEIPVDHPVCKVLISNVRAHDGFNLSMYSTNDPHPTYVTDPGMEKMGSWTFPIPPKARNMGHKPKLEVTMYVGRTHIEVFGKPLNFKGQEKLMFSTVFEGDLT